MTVQTFRLLGKPFYLQSGSHDVLLRFSTLWQAFARLKGVEDSSTFSSGLNCVTHMTYFLLSAFVGAAQAGKLAYQQDQDPTHRRCWNRSCSGHRTRFQDDRCELAQACSKYAV
jgi:hypothetical protein